jgi:hypothetical protein
VHLALLKSTLDDLVLLVEVGHLRSPVLETVQELALVQELLRLQPAPSVLLSLQELSFIVLAVGLLEPPAAMVLVVGDSAYVLGAVGASDDAVGVFLGVVLEAALVDVPAFILEDALPVLLASLETALVAVTARVDHLSLAIEGPSREPALILEGSLASLHLHQHPMPIKLATPELSAVL